MATQESREGSGCVHPQELRGWLVPSSSSLQISLEAKTEIAGFPPANHVSDMGYRFFHQVLSMVTGEGCVSEGRVCQLWMAPTQKALRTFRLCPLTVPHEGLLHEGVRSQPHATKLR